MPGNIAGKGVRERKGIVTWGRCSKIPPPKLTANYLGINSSNIVVAHSKVYENIIIHDGIPCLRKKTIINTTRELVFAETNFS